MSDVIIYGGAFNPPTIGHLKIIEYLVNNNDVFYLIGSAVGPEPYPEMVKYFQKIIRI